MNLPNQLNDDLDAAAKAAGATVRIGYPWWLRPFLAKDVVAITLGRRIYILPPFLLRPEREVAKLLRHELVHVRQAARLTLPLFLLLYGLEFLWHLGRERNVSRAYRKISFEREAWAAE